MKKAFIKLMNHENSPFIMLVMIVVVVGLVSSLDILK